MLALGLKQPALRLSPQEAALLAEGVAEVSEQFDAPINPKVMSVLNLFGAAAAVYIPRAVAIYVNAKLKPRSNTGGATVRSAEDATSAAQIRPATGGAPAGEVGEKGTMRFE